MTWTTDSGSIVILGKKQSGKTTAAREIHAETDRVSIWIMPKGNEAVPGVKGGGSPVGSKRALTQAVGEGRRHIVWKAADVVQAVIDVQEWAWDVAQKSGREARLQVVIDEIHNVAPENARSDQQRGRDAVRKVAKEGEKRNLKLIAITQDPVAMDKQVLRQMEYVMMFQIAPAQRDPFSRWGIDWLAVTDAPEHCAVVFQNELSGASGNAKLLVPQACPEPRHTV